VGVRRYTLIRSTKTLTLVDTSDNGCPVRHKGSQQLLDIISIETKAISVFSATVAETATDRRLPRSDLAGEQNKAAIAGDPVYQMSQCLAVFTAHIEIAGIRGDRKR
jgi:hypothetical protein